MSIFGISTIENLGKNMFSVVISEKNFLKVLGGPSTFLEMVTAITPHPDAIGKSCLARELLSMGPTSGISGVAKLGCHFVQFPCEPTRL